MVDVAEAVQDVGLPGAPARLAERLECLLAVGEGLLVVAEPGVVPADVVQAHSLARPVSCRPVETDGLLDMVQRLTARNPQIWLGSELLAGGCPPHTAWVRSSALTTSPAASASTPARRSPATGCGWPSTTTSTGPRRRTCMMPGLYRRTGPDAAMNRESGTGVTRRPGGEAPGRRGRP